MNCHSTHNLLNYYNNPSAIYLLMAMNGLKRKWTCKTFNQQNKWQIMYLGNPA